MHWPPYTYLDFILLSFSLLVSFCFLPIPVINCTCVLLAALSASTAALECVPIRVSNAVTPAFLLLPKYKTTSCQSILAVFMYNIHYLFGAPARVQHVILVCCLKMTSHEQKILVYFGDIEKTILSYHLACQSAYSSAQWRDF